MDWGPPEVGWGPPGWVGVTVGGLGPRGVCWGSGCADAVSPPPPPPRCPPGAPQLSRVPLRELPAVPAGPAPRPPLPVPIQERLHHQHRGVSVGGGWGGPGGVPGGSRGGGGGQDGGAARRLERCPVNLKPRRGLAARRDCGGEESGVRTPPSKRKGVGGGPRGVCVCGVGGLWGSDPHPGAGRAFGAAVGQPQPSALLRLRVGDAPQGGRHCGNTAQRWAFTPPHPHPTSPPPLRGGPSAP